VALQEDVDELNDNFNTEVANIKSRLSTLETSSIPANITNRVATLEANVAALQVTVNALSAGDSVDLTALTEAVNDIADDVLAAHSSIDAIRGDVNDINLDITDLKNKYNSITIPDYDSRIQEVELRIVGILYDLQGYETEINAIKKYLNDADTVVGSLNYQLKQINTKLDTLNNNDLYLQDLINTTLLNNADITGFSKLTATTYQASFKINKAGTFAVILTLYGTGLDTAVGSAGSYTYIPLAECVYGNGDTMKTILLSPDSIKPTTTNSTIIQWTAGQTFTVYFTITSGSITCIDIDTGVR
jgi:hypothetical protein